MKKYLSIFYYLILILITSNSFGNDKYNFQLKVIAEDNLIKKQIEESVLKNLKKINNIQINNNENFKDGVSVVVLYIYGKKHENSNIDKQIITFHSNPLLK